MKQRTDKPIIVPERDAGKRLDAFLSAFLKREKGDAAPSRAKVREAIESGNASINDALEHAPSRRLTRGDAVSFEVPEMRTELLPNPNVLVTVIFESDELLVIDKPAGIATHPVSPEETDTVARWVVAHAPEVIHIGEDSLRPGIAHRLDRFTSGILVIAKTAAAFDELKRIFSDRLAEKRYLAIVLGHAPEESGEIRLPIAPQTGTLKRQAILPSNDIPEDAREALSHYRVKQRFVEHDLLEVSPKTGRTHQIRVHLAAIGCPVLGDRLYGGRRMNRDGVPARQMLHAGYLAFPWEGKTLTFEAPLPSDFTKTLSMLDEM